MKKLIMPDDKLIPRRPYEDDKPFGYMESNRDYFENNNDLTEWLLDNSEEIRLMIKKYNESI